MTFFSLSCKNKGKLWTSTDFPAPAPHGERNPSVVLEWMNSLCYCITVVLILCNQCCLLCVATLSSYLLQDKDISSHPREPCIFWTSCLRMGWITIAAPRATATPVRLVRATARVSSCQVSAMFKLNNCQCHKLVFTTTLLFIHTDGTWLYWRECRWSSSHTLTVFQLVKLHKTEECTSLNYELHQPKWYQPWKCCPHELWVN